MENPNEQHSYPDYGDHYGDHFMSQNNNYFNNYDPFQTQNTSAGPSQINSNFYRSQEIQMEEIINDGVRRSNAVYNLSETDNLNSYQEMDSEDLESEESGEDADDSDSSSADDNARDDVQNNETTHTEEHTPTAPWFTTEEVTANNITNNPGDFPNFNPLGDDLFEGQCFVDKKTAVSAIKAIHIKKSRDYHVLKSTTTLYEAKCVVTECPWRIRVIKRKRYGHFEITKLPVEHNCLFRTIQLDHKKLSSRLIADTIKNQVIIKL